MKETIEKKEQLMPYERFIKYGAGALGDEELLAIILRTGTKNVSAVELGNSILNLNPCYRGLSGLYHISVEELEKIKGIGKVKAVKIKCIAELAMRMAMENARTTLSFTKPSSIAEYYMEKMRHEELETVFLLLFDSKMHLIKELILSIGTVSGSMLSPREVFLTALKYQAVNIVIMHNHPSGDPSPSTQDIEITRRIENLGKMLVIPLIDHIIIGDNKYISFKESGYL